jgi:hypothetical protein
MRLAIRGRILISIFQSFRLGLGLGKAHIGIARQGRVVMWAIDFENRNAIAA